MSARTVGLLSWLLIGGLAAVAVFWQLTHPPRPPAQAAAAQRPPELPTVAATQPFQLPPLDQYGEIVAHPLFIPTRRPEPAAPEEAPPEKPVSAPEQRLMLLGVMITPDQKAALLRPEEPNARTARVRLGDMVGEWRLEAIFPNRVVVSRGGVTQELTLARPKRPTGPRAGRAAGAKPPQEAVPATSVPVAPPQPAELPQSILTPAFPPPPNDG